MTIKKFYAYDQNGEINYNYLVNQVSWKKLNKKNKKLLITKLERRLEILS